MDKGRLSRDKGTEIGELSLQAKAHEELLASPEKAADSCRADFPLRSSRAAVFMKEYLKLLALMGPYIFVVLIQSVGGTLTINADMEMNAEKFWSSVDSLIQNLPSSDHVLHDFLSSLLASVFPSALSSLVKHWWFSGVSVGSLLTPPPKPLQVSLLQYLFPCPTLGHPSQQQTDASSHLEVQKECLLLMFYDLAYY